MNRPQNINSAHLGNGLAVYKIEEAIFVAHISPYREITNMANNLNKEERDYIEYLAKTDDRNISVIQDTKVFKTRPNEVRK